MMGKKIASLYAEIGADTTKLQSGLSAAKTSVSQFGSGLDKLNNSGIGQVVKGLTGLNISSVGVAGAVIAAGNAIKKSVTDWSDYAEQMDKSAKLSGVSVEEMSRLTQAADDFRVSQDALKTSMKMALQNGFTPTIENLAKLSDQFIAIKDPSERAALASGIFGRSWQEIAPLLLKGGDAIRSGTAAIADNLVVTGAAVKQNNAYIKAMDDLDDAMIGFKNQLAQGVIPSWTEFINLVTSPTSQNAADLINTMFKGSFLESDMSKARTAAEELAVGIAADTNELIKLKDAAGDAAPSLDFLADATNNADAAMRKYSDVLLFNIASQGLSEAGALALAQRMGLVDEKTVLATEKVQGYQAMLDAGTISLETYNNLVSGLADSLDRLEDKTVTVTYNQITTGTAPNGYWQGTGGEGSTQGQRAAGGPVMAGLPYWVGERGPELFVPGNNGGVIIPNDESMAIAHGRNVTITQNIYTQIDYEEAAARIADVVRRA